MTPRTRTPRGTRSRRGWPLAAGAVVIALAVYFVPRLVTDTDARHALAKAFAQDPETLVMNLPPAPQRYPGTVLMNSLAYPIDLVQGDDPALKRGEEHEFDLSYTADAEATGSMQTAAFKEALKHRELVDITMHIRGARIVEMTAVDLRKRLEHLGLAAGEAVQNGPKLICRAFEGRLELLLKRKSTASGEAWTNLSGALTKAGTSETATELKVEASGEAGSELAIRYTTPIVFAFQVADARAFLSELASVLPPPARSEKVERDPRRAIDELIRFDPSRVPVLASTLAEIGPGASAAIVEATRAGDPLVRSRAERLLQLAEPPPEVDAGGAVGALASSSEAARAWGVMHLPLQGPRAVEQRATALEDPDVAVRHFAVASLEALGSSDAAAVKALEAATADPDVSIRLRATGAIVKVKPASPHAIDGLLHVIDGPHGETARVWMQTLPPNDARTILQKLPVAARDELVKLKPQ